MSLRQKRNRTARQIASLALLLAAACGQRAGTNVSVLSRRPERAKSVGVAQSSAPSSRRTGDVTVALVIDQFAAWVARERLPLLPGATRALARGVPKAAAACSGGFSRLREEGTWFTDVRFAHAITETAVGHASLHTGRTPHEHGIVANEIRRAGATVGILTDPQTRVVSGVGTTLEPGSSARAVQSELVADRLRAQDQTAKIYAFSLKDRGAIVGGGHRPDLSLWYDAKMGEFVSSSAFAGALPNWVVQAAGHAAIEALLTETWNLLEPEWAETHSLTDDKQPGESNYMGYGIEFPHRAGDSQQPFAVFRGHPASDRLLLGLALRALDESPTQSPVYLAISLSANDYIGHWFGPDSYEAWDELLRLDASLAAFFCELDRRQGPEHWSLVLSADHGVLPLPEVNQALNGQGSGSSSRPRAVGGRIYASELEKVALRAAEKAVGSGQWIDSVTDPYLYWSSLAKRLAPDRFARLRGEVTRALTAVPGVARLYDVAVLPKDCPPPSDESLDALVCRSVQAGIGGDYFISLGPGYFFDTGYSPGSGTSHGNAETYDRSVPVLVRAPGRVAANRVVHETQSFTIYARLLEQLLGL